MTLSDRGVERRSATENTIDIPRPFLPLLIFRHDVCCLLNERLLHILGVFGTRRRDLSRFEKLEMRENVRGCQL